MICESFSKSYERDGHLILNENFFSARTILFTLGKRLRNNYYLPMPAHI